MFGLDFETLTDYICVLYVVVLRKKVVKYTCNRCVFLVYVVASNLGFKLFYNNTSVIQKKENLGIVPGLEKLNRNAQIKRNIFIIFKDHCFNRSSHSAPINYFEQSQEVTNIECIVCQSIDIARRNVSNAHAPNLTKLFKCILISFYKRYKLKYNII